MSVATMPVDSLSNFALFYVFLTAPISQATPCPIKFTFAIGGYGRLDRDGNVMSRRMIGQRLFRSQFLRPVESVQA